MLTVLLAAWGVLTSAPSAGGQVGATAGRPQLVREVPVRVLRAEIKRFDKPIRFGLEERAIEYREALVLELAVDAARFDALPPDIEPYLYIGQREYRIFHIDRPDEGKELVLTFHVRDWPQLAERAPMVLTIDHGAPLREPARFARGEWERFSHRLVRDLRVPNER